MLFTRHVFTDACHATPLIRYHALLRCERFASAAYRPPLRCCLMMPLIARCLRLLCCCAAMLSLLLPLHATLLMPRPLLLRAICDN